MFATIILTNITTGYVEENKALNIENRHCFQYIDKENNLCEMCTYDNGICFFKQYNDHLLELHLREHNYAKLTTEEGEIKIDVKVVDFNENNDILVMRYVIDEEEREIRIIYRS